MKIYLIFLSILFGCSSPASKPQSLDYSKEFPIIDPSLTSMPTVIVWSDYKWENNGPLLWYAEARKKFKHPVVFMCHGMFANGVWYVNPDKPRQRLPANDVAKMLANFYPGCEICFIVCNSNHVRLFIPNVYYAIDDVWVRPFSGIKDWEILDDLANAPKTIGSLDIFETPPAPITLPSTNP